ncbi:hypothetical protein [Aquipseudomonas campi]
MTTTNTPQLAAICAADLPAPGQDLGGAIFVTRYWLNGQERTLELLPDELAGAWGEYGQDVQTTHGDGHANTIAMAAAGSGLAKQALELGGFIPSALESHLLMHAKQGGLVTLREDRFQWTSTQWSASYAFLMDFEGGWQLDHCKYHERLVRPVRSRVIQ